MSALPRSEPRPSTAPEAARLLDAGRLWDALRAADGAGSDGRPIAAAACVRLGLKTAALEYLREAGAGPDVEALQRLALQLPDDHLPAATRIERASRNVEALFERGVDVRAALDAWSRSVEDENWFEAADGNVVRRRATGGAWLRVADDRGDARRVALPAGVGAADVQQCKPITIEGIDPPWLLLRMVEATPATQNGHRPRINVVQADVGELLDGLACADLRDVIGDDRVRFFVGADASVAFDRDLRSRFDTIIAGPIVRMHAKQRAAPSPEAVIEAVARDQGAEHERLTREVAKKYAERNVEWWRKRYEEAFAAGRPLRVLIPTCRYSTFVRHSAEDLAEAARARGLEARLVIEPDDSSRLASVAYLRALSEFEPDLVLTINYPRASLGPIADASVPFVCWVQDAMPQVFEKASGGPLDLLVGHLDVPEFVRLGHDRSRLLALGVPANPRKFHRGDVEPELRRKHECEIAYVGHQSEPPDAMHRRMLEASKASPAAAKLMETLRPKVLEIAAQAGQVSAYASIDAAVRGAIRSLSGREPDARMVSLITHQYAMPLADRAFRHQALRWAAEIAEERGWRMRVYGRGWDTHPELNQFAVGPIEHGEDLRACYQAASCHLHVSIRNMIHQRPIECAMSGGLPIVRATMDELQSLRLWIMSRVVREAPAHASLLGSRRQIWRYWSHPLLLRWNSIRQRHGLPQEHCEWLDDWMETRLHAGDVPAEEHLADWLYGGWGELMFTTKDSLKERLVMAVESPRWRERMSTGVAKRAASSLTTDAGVERVIDLVRQGLGRND